MNVPHRSSTHAPRASHRLVSLLQSALLCRAAVTFPGDVSLVDATERNGQPPFPEFCTNRDGIENTNRNQQSPLRSEAAMTTTSMVPFRTWEERGHPGRRTVCGGDGDRGSLAVQAQSGSAPPTVAAVAAGLVRAAAGSPARHGVQPAGSRIERPGTADGPSPRNGMVGDLVRG